MATYTANFSFTFYNNNNNAYSTKFYNSSTNIVTLVISGLHEGDIGNPNITIKSLVTYYSDGTQNSNNARYIISGNSITFPNFQIAKESSGKPKKITNIVLTIIYSNPDANIHETEEIYEPDDSFDIVRAEEAVVWMSGISQYVRGIPVIYVDGKFKAIRNVLQAVDASTENVDLIEDAVVFNLQNKSIAEVEE